MDNYFLLKQAIGAKPKEVETIHFGSQDDCQAKLNELKSRNLIDDAIDIYFIESATAYNIRMVTN